MTKNTQKFKFVKSQAQSPQKFSPYVSLRKYVVGFALKFKRQAI